MEIGIISDTHSFLDPNVFEAFEDCEEIWHAGDFGTLDVAKELADFLPLRGVYGNIDSTDIRLRYPEDLRFQCEGVDILMTHIAGRPGRYPARVRQQLLASQPDTLICGHSHIVHVEKDPRFKGMTYLNPGAAGHEGAHLMRTVIKCRCADGKMTNMRLVELGSRGRRAKATNV